MTVIGDTLDGAPVALSENERSRHIHVLGATGTGKSKLLEHLIRQDIAQGRGLCLIDPHGTLSDNIERWCASRALGKVRRIHLVKPGASDWTAGFNPLRLGRGEAPAVRVDAMVAACAQVWGGADMNQTPRLKKILRALFFALAVRELTLAEGLLLMRAGDPEGVRRALTADLPDPVFGVVWDELNALSRREFSEIAESTINRLTELLASPAVRLMVGQRAHALDLRQVMDGSEVVLVNLGSRGSFSYANARVVGSLIINDLFLTALGRDERMARRRPFTLYVDEAYDFLSGDVERILDQCRKFGLHAVLVHQRLGQLRERGEGIYNAVMGNARTKVVFGGLPDDDAAVMAREMLRDEVDLERPKHALDKPTVVDEEVVWLESRSESEGGSESRSFVESATWSEVETRTESNVLSETEGLGFREEEWESPEQVSSSAGAGTSYAESSSGSRSQGGGSATSETESSQWSRTEGASQTLKAVRQVLPTALHGLDEELHRAQVRLRKLPDRHAVVKRVGERSVEVRTPDVAEALHTAGLMERFRRTVFDRSPYAAETAVAEREVEDRQKRIGPVRPADQSFWTEE